MIKKNLHGAFMGKLKISNRHRLQKKAVRNLVKMFNDTFSSDFNLGQCAIDSAMIDKFEILIIDNEVIGLIINGQPFFTIRGILRFQPKTRFVTVDMGAVKFISNGANVMAPGIIDAYPEITINDIVWIRDENNLKPLLIGCALMNGPAMIQSTSDIAVESIHYIGDTLWKLSL